VIAAAGRIAGEAESIGAAHLAAGLLAEPEGVAARVIHGAGLTDEQVYAALRTGTAQSAAPGNGDMDAAALRELAFTRSGVAVLKGALKAALRLGHNYIGTEHVLLGVLCTEGDTADALTSLGLTTETAERLLSEEFARFQAQRQAD
jgi:ATP-dependent Clp protease ATP-binding subunit ClpA